MNMKSWISFIVGLFLISMLVHAYTTSTLGNVVVQGSIEATNSDNNISSSGIKEPPAAPALGYCISHFNDNFSSATVDYFPFDGANYLESIDMQGFTLSNGTISPEYIDGGTWTDSQDGNQQDLTDISNMSADTFYLGNGSTKVTVGYDEVICQTIDIGCTVVCTDSDCADDIRSVTAENQSILVKGGTYGLGSNITIYNNMIFECEKDVIFDVSGSDEAVYISGNNSILKNCRFEADSNTANYLIDVKGCDDVKIEGIKIKNASEHGVFFHGCPGTSRGYQLIQNSEIIGYGIDSTGYAIYMDYSKGVNVLDNYIEQVGGCACDAIEMGHEGDMIVRGNRIIGTDNKVSINFPFAHNSIIEGNLLINAGIHNDVNTANNVTIQNNKIYDFEGPNYYGGIRAYGDDNTVTGNDIYVSSPSSATGGIFIYGKRTTVTANTVVGSGSGFGIYFDDNDCTASGNNIRNFNKGINIIQNSNMITNNNIRDCTYGVYATASSTSGVVMYNNTVKGNVYDSVTHKEYPGNWVQIKNNYYENYLYNCSDNSIRDCTSEMEYYSINKWNDTASGTYYRCMCIDEEWICDAYNSYEALWMTTGNDMATINTSKRIGIGTTTPTATFEINHSCTLTTGNTMKLVRNLGSSDTDSPMIYVKQDNTGDDQSVGQYYQDATSIPMFKFFTAASATGGTYELWESGTVRFTIGIDTSPNNYYTIASGSGLGNDILSLIEGKVILNGTVVVGDGSTQKNITMTAPNGNEGCCGMGNDYVFNCTAGAC